MAKAFYLNYVNDAMIHEQTNSKNGNKFYNISTPWAGSLTGLATLAVFPNQVFEAKNRKTGEVISGCKNVRLGYETSKNQNVRLSICTKLTKAGKPAKNGFQTIEVPMADVVAARKAEYEAYKASQSEQETVADAE